ncbi:hypothetical protein DITRI_Ditri04bG0074300 [Diplodiscus trichospermus]
MGKSLKMEKGSATAKQQEISNAKQSSISHETSIGVVEEVSFKRNQLIEVRFKVLLCLQFANLYLRTKVLIDYYYDSDFCTKAVSLWLSFEKNELMNKSSTLRILPVRLRASVGCVMDMELKLRALRNQIREKFIFSIKLQKEQAKARQVAIPAVNGAL